jgi:hypothetical protein
MTLFRTLLASLAFGIASPVLANAQAANGRFDSQPGLTFRVERDEFAGAMMVRSPQINVFVDPPGTASTFVPRNPNPENFRGDALVYYQLVCSVDVATKKRFYIMLVYIGNKERERRFYSRAADNRANQLTVISDSSHQASDLVSVFLNPATVDPEPTALTVRLYARSSYLNRDIQVPATYLEHLKTSCDEMVSPNTNPGD